MDKENEETGEVEQIPFLKYINVFHISQCEGIAAKHMQTNPNPASPDAAAEAIITEYVKREGVRLEHRAGDSAFYNPSQDCIVLPMLAQFTETAEYYGTAFHEMVHSTGHAKRLARLDTTANFGGEEYSKEELVAEIGSAALVHHAGLETPQSFTNSTAYVQNWLQVLKNDKRFIVSAPGQIRKSHNAGTCTNGHAACAAWPFVCLYCMEMMDIIHLNNINRYDMIASTSRSLRRTVYKFHILKGDICMKGLLKKVLTAMLALSLLVGLTASVSAETAGKQKLVWWVWATEDIARQMSRAAFEAVPELADKYEIEPVLVSSSTEVVQKFRLLLASGETAPDIMMFQSEFLPEFGREGILTDVSDILNAYKDQLTGGAYNLVSYGGKQWGFPYQLKPSVWVYRGDMFKEAGIDPAEVKTTDDFIAAGKKLQEVYPGACIFQFDSNQFPYAILVHILSGNGGTFFNEDGEYILDEDPGVRAAFEDIKKMYDAGIVYDVVADSNDMIQAYAEGTIASTLTGTWIKNNMQKWAPDLKGLWQEAQWPAIGGGVPGGEGGSMFVVPANSKNPEGAIEVLSALSLTVQGNLNGYTERSIYPSLKEAVQNDLIKAPHKYMGETLYEAEAQATENFKSFAYSPKFAMEMEIIVPYLAEYLHDKCTLDDALTKANDDLNMQLDNALED